MSADFDWHNDDSVVVPPQLGVAVYINERHELCIRQQADFYDEQDSFVIVARANLGTLIQALQHFAEQADAGGEIPHVEKPRDATAALRQRRRRERKRHGDNVVTLPQAAE